MKELELRDDDGRSVGPKCRHTSPCKRAAGGAEDAKLLALETEEGIMSQGCKGCSARWTAGRGKGKDSVLQPPEGVGPRQRLESA